MRSVQTVDILLATFNGAAFLAEQLESLLAQTHQDWRVIARDDGSSDGTVAILDEYVKAFPTRFTVVRDGLKLGAKAGFASLMTQSAAPYVTFCDQDDVWQPEKLEVLLRTIRAAEAAHGESVPLLVHSDLEVVDASLERIAPSFWQHQGIDPGRDRVSQLIVQNVVTGCASLFNRALLEVALPVPPEAFMHDYWLSLVASARGKIIAVPEPCVRYRQHGKNTVGAKKMPGLFSLPSRIFSREGRRFDYSAACAQARSLQAALGEAVPESVSDCLSAFSNLYRYGWLGRRAVLIRHGIFPARLRRQLYVLLRV
ncbi:glycosyltransferase family 2 protein [Uliginosibacterium sp. TH139]|uniref:glycosyltransferase family 2 protein n=1 Tax=Uliginosibacterium sp. TH139 TaxID=2067453 RepID=UPI000C7CACFA|nr:glycosyltransferase family 2 protein [Uliginosibacterium sp. TH139]PLK49142.1 glycosyltransferase family 2 protein [Uliginosibacterium sp. TH139]